VRTYLLHGGFDCRCNLLIINADKIITLLAQQTRKDGGKTVLKTKKNKHGSKTNSDGAKTKLTNLNDGDCQEDCNG